ncbi:Crp/Fnr family transcriptional regulator [Candidatus Acetothermia bacterium]|nr:Crp/Fnr family transcriptional regulator [Candidatus Acetothermia bacterium]MCI2431704.1 Crp/Fnr family transcriptional regulator [Candidatus Acetothermia bacterium]MCI2435679.1 Crp/Fnr family transcriptional regulator [Candidatus Acetothermia bacterium]
MAIKRVVLQAKHPKGPLICGSEGCAGCSWIFQGLSESDQQELQKLMRPVRYEADETIFHEGAPAFGFFIICQGQVKLVKQGSGAKRQILKIIGPGELLGEENIFNGKAHGASARTLEPTSARFVKREEFLDFLKRHPQVALQLAEKIARELQGFQAKLIEVAYEGCRARLARILLALAREYGAEEKEGLRITAKLTRNDLAEMAGISTETAIRTLTELEERRLIRLERRKICILDQDGLEELAAALPGEPTENVL